MYFDQKQTNVNVEKYQFCTLITVTKELSQNGLYFQFF